ncbi:MAG TPA: PilZ domain-containing protein [Anaeromyxobacteraceae bacterium]
MEELFHSIARAFAHDSRGLPAVEISLLTLLAAAVALQLAAVVRRWRARRSLLRRFAARTGLSEEDLAFVTGLSRRASVAPLSLLTHLDLFERATAQALAGRALAASPDREDPAPRIRRIRRLLGFDHLPVHTPLITSRELAPGTAVDVVGQRGQTFEVDETSFSLEVPTSLGLPPGKAVQLALVRAREARYELKCQLLAELPGRGGAWCLVFAHDEAPARIQLREYARVPAKGAVALRPLGPRLARPGDGPAELRGELVNVSGGGVLVETRARLPVGSLLSASFVIAGRRFADLRAVVLSVVPAVDDRFRAHLEFRRIAEAGGDQLVSAVGQLALAQRAAACPH